MHSWGGQPLPARSPAESIGGYGRSEMIGDQQINRKSEREIKMRDPYNVPLDEINREDEMPGLGWRGDAQCLGREPREYELDGNEYKGTNRQARARELCEGCSVVRECAGEALEPLAESTVRAGVWIPAAAHGHIRSRVVYALSEIALGEAGPDDFLELLEPVHGRDKDSSPRASSRASAHPSLTPLGMPPVSSPPAPLPASRGVGGRG